MIIMIDMIIKIISSAWIIIIIILTLVSLVCVFSPILLFLIYKNKETDIWISLVNPIYTKLHAIFFNKIYSTWLGAFHMAQEA